MRARAGWLKAGVLSAGGLQGSTGGAGVESGGGSLVSGLSLAAAEDGGAQLGKAAGLGAVVIAQRILGGAGIEKGGVGTGQRMAGGDGGQVDGRGRRDYLGTGWLLGLQLGQGGAQGSPLGRNLASSRAHDGRGWGNGDARHGRAPRQTHPRP